MVSVKKFIHDEPSLFKASKAFVALLYKCADPVVYVACKMPDKNEQIAWTLLGTVLFQDRSYPDILRLLAKLYERFPGDKLWTLPVPKASEIEDVVERTFNSRNWSVLKMLLEYFGVSGFLSVVIQTLLPGPVNALPKKCGATWAKSISWDVRTSDPRRALRFIG